MASIEPKRGGLRWVRSQGSPSATAPTITGVVATAYGYAIFRGDPVVKIADGSYELSGATGKVDGVCNGVESYYDSGFGGTRSGTFLPASTAYTGGISLTNPLASKITVIPSDDQVFEMDVGAGVANAATAQSHVGVNCSMTATAGSTMNGQSGYVVNASTFATTNSLNLRVLEIPRYGRDNPLMNDVTAVNWKVLVKANLNNDVDPGTTTGV